MAKKSVKEKVEFTEEELKEDFFDSKEDKESVIAKIVNILLWIILFTWIAVCVVDFYRTQKGNKPLFTFTHNVTKYEDGKVDSYLGLGYKVYKYERKCFNGYEFGPFWSKDRSIGSENCSK